MWYHCLLVLWSLFKLSLFPFCTDGAACNGDTYGTDPLTNLDVRDYEEDSADSGVLVSLDDYTITCDCGVITEWSFYAKRGGTTHFFVSRSGTIVGSTKVFVQQIAPADTLSDNYFHIALSSETWISVQKDDKLGFYTEGDPPMITYHNTTGYDVTRDTGLLSLPTTVSGSTINDRRYAVFAKVETDKAPFFLNLPYTTTLYTHETGTVIHTYSVTDLDPQDVGSLTVTKTAGDGAFVLDTGAQTLTYQTKLPVSGSPYTVSLEVADTCGNTDTQTVTIILIDEPPYFDNLPAGGENIFIKEDGTTGSDLPFTISVTDPSGDTVTCSKLGVAPASGFALFSITGLVVSYTGGAISYATSPYYDILISCTDGTNTIYSNIVVDIVKNEPPTIDNLPNSTLSVDINNVPATIFTVIASDPENDGLTYSLTCTSISGAACPFSIDAAGVVTATDSLDDAGYDNIITVDDGNGNLDTGKLTVTVTGFKSKPTFTNLPATRNIVEGTPTGTYLYTVNYKDENIFNTFTLSVVYNNGVEEYIYFDVATGVVSTNNTFDYEALGGTTTFTIDITVTDDSGESDSGTMTFNFENRNEAPTISIATPTITADEGPKDTVFTDPVISGNDSESGGTENLTFSLNCGTNSKYFYLNDADLLIYFSREYDLDAGRDSTVNCTVTVSDPKGLQDSDTLTLSINDVNDNAPRFPKLYYTYFLMPDDLPNTFIADLAAYDNDSTNDVLAYSMANGKSGSPDSYFTIDSAGQLYVKNVSSFPEGSTYYFDVVVADTDNNPSVLSGSASVFIIFSGVRDPDATTTTERSFTFKEDHANYAWLTVVGVVVLALLIVIVFIIYLEPPVRKAFARRYLRIQKLFQEKPKEPLRIPVGMLKIEMGNKVLENDPDSKLPWEFQASKDKVEDKMDKMKGKMKPVKELKIISGVPKVTSVEAEVHSPVGEDNKDSKNKPDDEEDSDNSENDENAGADQWGDLAVGGTNKK